MLGWESSASALAAVGVVALGLGRGRDARRRRARPRRALRPLLDELAEHDRLLQGRVFDHGVWAMGALAIGIGIVPMVVGIAALAAPKGEPRDPQTRAFVVTSVAAIAVFIAYAGIKGAYISTGSRRSSSSGTSSTSALSCTRPRRWPWSVASGATGQSPWRPPSRSSSSRRRPSTSRTTRTTRHTGSRSPPSRTGSSSGRRSRIENGLLVVCGLALAFVVALRSSAAARARTASSPGRPRFVLAWTLTAQVYAAEGERDLSTRVARNLPSPYDWVEEETDGGSVVVVGQQVADPTNVWLTEFFNPSIRKMWSLDGTAPGPGRSSRPDLVAADGTLTPPPGTEYALGINGVELQARSSRGAPTRGSTGSAISR